MTVEMLVDWLTLTFTGSNALGNMASVGTITAFLIAIRKYFSNTQRLEMEHMQKEKAERKRASENLYRELLDTLEGLDRASNRDARSFKTKDGKEIFFVSRFLNHDFYDSLVYSGKINFLRPKLQQHVQNIFRQIKTHNEYLILVRKMQDNASNLEVPEKSYSYFEWMDEHEQKLLKDIPLVQKELKEGFDISPP